MSTTDSRPRVRVEVVDDSEYAVEMAHLEALRDETAAFLITEGSPELAAELLDGWNTVAVR